MPTEKQSGATRDHYREERMRNDPSGGKASYWLRRAAANLDCAVQCCGTDESAEIDAMESRCDEMSALLKERDGN